MEEETRSDPPEPPPVPAARRGWPFVGAWLGRTPPRAYLTAGLSLFLLKYLLDHSIAAFGFGIPWHPARYLLPSAYYTIWSVPPDQRLFYWLLVLLSLPFIGAGVALTVRRLRDAGLPLWLSFLFFIPFANLPFFLVLCITPSARPRAASPPPDEFEDDADPPDLLDPEYNDKKGRLLSGLIAAAVSAAGALVIIATGTQVLRHYGWGLFIGVPFCMGLISALVHGFSRPRSLASCFAATVSSLGIVAVGLLLFAWEGVICILMASPIAVIVAGFGTMVGWAIQHYPRAEGRPPERGSETRLYSASAVGLPVFLILEALLAPSPQLLAVTSEIVIRATPERVWRHVVSFEELPPVQPDEWLFRAGVACPVRADIIGRGPGAVRRCVFTTGAFVEPIEIWDEPRLLRFSVTEQPPAMRELSVYSHVHPPHLDDYLRSERGQFLLEPLPDGSTRLSGTTWYRNAMWPSAYWQLWSDSIIHRIHLRVLRHIKSLAESRSPDA